MRKAVKILATILAGLIICWIVSFFIGSKNKNMIYGVSFNSEYASYLKLDPKIVFGAILDNWKFRHIRLSAQWDAIEKKQAQYDFTELDWLMNEAAKRNAKVTLAVGRKTPRWPECHLPEWVREKNLEEYKQPLYDFISAVVKRYKMHPALELWQVENEPFLAFGACAPLPENILKEEMSLVKEIDSGHEIMVTDSGELSFWTRTARASDIFGTTMYRVVWSKWFGYWSYDWILPPFAYRFKLWFNGRTPDKAYISELQAEPWIPDMNLFDASLDEQFKSMSLKQMEKNINTAARTGMSRAYLWGAEWWYWLEKQGHGEYVDFVKNLKKE
jgi:hypothetical protein